jgi:hypothetical protein
MKKSSLVLPDPRKPVMMVMGIIVYHLELTNLLYCEEGRGRALLLMGPHLPAGS